VSNLVKATQRAVVQSKSVSGAAGKGLVVGGGSAIAVTLLAAFLPFFGVLSLSIVMVVLGIFMWE
jgi:hypothetical protein